MTVPKGWVKEEIPPSATAPVAVFKIPRADPGSEDSIVRITHEPGMKGKDMVDRSIDLWVSQVAKPDGSSMTRADAKIATSQLDSIRLTIVDLTGTVKMSAREAGKPGRRMIAAILDHPQGPHFIVAVGPTASMQKWASTVDGFLRSAKAE